MIKKPKKQNLIVKKKRSVEFVTIGSLDVEIDFELNFIFYTQTAATTSTMLYVARTIDMFVSVRALTLKSIVSVFVDSTELGKILCN